MRTYINMKTVFSLLIVLFLVLTINITTSDAQDSPQWHLPDGARARLGKGTVEGIAYSSDGSSLAVASNIGIWIYDVHTGTEQALLTGHTGNVNSVAFSSDGSTLASGSWDGTVRLWDVTTGTLENTLPRQGISVISVVFSPDGSTIASGDWDKRVRLWDVATGSLINTLTGHTGWVESVAFSPDGSTLASSGGVFSDRTIRLWDVATGNPINVLEDIDRVESVAFSPDGSTLASSGGFNTTVRLWDVATGTSRNPLTGHTAWVRSVAFSPDGSTLASGSWDNTVRLWDVATGTAGNTLMGHTGGVNSVTFSSDGSTLASGSNDRTVRLWDVATGAPRNTLMGHTDSVDSVAFSSDDSTLASGSWDGTVLLWQLISKPTPPPITFTPTEIPDQTFVANTPIDPVSLPVASGGTPPYTYTLEPLPDGLVFDSATQVLSGTPTTEGTTRLTYTATDTGGASAALTFNIEVIGDGPGPGTDPLDVNGDGEVTVIDLAIVALFYGTQVPVGVSLPADVNADGVVDLADLTAVAHGIDAAGGNLGGLSLEAVEAALVAAAEQAAALEVIAEAPMRKGHGQVLPRDIAYHNVADALVEARHLGYSVPAVLQRLLQLLTEMRTIPETTALLPNYPNPFNPETWLPYHLAEAADVTLRIYAANGQLVRKMVLGHQPAGIYQSKSRAAYWNGKNENGEPVASGLYFYTLTAGEFTATRKLLIRK